MSKELMLEKMKNINNVLGIVRKTNDKTVSMLNTLTIVDLNLQINSAQLRDSTDRTVVSEFGKQISREIEIMQSQMKEMLSHRQELKDNIDELKKLIEEME